VSLRRNLYGLLNIPWNGVWEVCLSTMQTMPTVGLWGWTHRIEKGLGGLGAPRAGGGGPGGGGAHRFPEARRSHPRQGNDSTCHITDTLSTQTGNLLIYGLDQPGQGGELLEKPSPFFLGGLHSLQELQHSLSSDSWIHKPNDAVFANGIKYYATQPDASATIRGCRLTQAGPRNPSIFVPFNSSFRGPTLRPPTLDNFGSTTTMCSPPPSAIHSSPGGGLRGSGLAQRWNIPCGCPQRTKSFIPGHPDSPQDSPHHRNAGLRYEERGGACTLAILNKAVTLLMRLNDSNSRSRISSS
jgi:hypothetical protein